MDKIFINEKGWVELIWGKKIDMENYLRAAQKMLELLSELVDSGKPSLLLIDFSQLEEITQEAASVASKATRDLGCYKIAGFGIKPEFAAILDTIKRLSTKADSIREFNTREEAEKWILEK